MLLFIMSLQMVNSAKSFIPVLATENIAENMPLFIMLRHMPNQIFVEYESPFAIGHRARVVPVTVVSPVVIELVLLVEFAVAGLAR